MEVIDEHVSLRYKRLFSKIIIALTLIHIIGLFVDWIGYWLIDGYVDMKFDLYGFLYFCVDYSKGIVPRGICGEIGKLIFGSGNISVPTFVFVFKTVIIALMFLAMIFFLFYCYKKNFELGIFVALLLFRPFYFLSKLYVIKSDNFWYLGLIFIVLLLWNDSHITIKTVAVTLISTACMLFHHGFLFVFAPLVCLFLFEKKQYKHMFTYGVIMCIEFLLFSFVFKGDYEYIVTHAEELLRQYGMSESSIEHMYDGDIILALQSDYQMSRFTQTFEHKFLLGQYVHYHIPVMVMYILASLAGVYAIWSVISKYTKEHKCSLLVLAAYIIPFLFLMLFTVDCDRWFLMYFMSASVFALYLVFKRNVKFEFKPIYISLLMSSVIFQIILFFLNMFLWL